MANLEVKGLKFNQHDCGDMYISIQFSLQYLVRLLLFCWYRAWLEIMRHIFYHLGNTKRTEENSLNYFTQNPNWKVCEVCDTGICLTNRLHFSVCVYCNRSQMTSQCVENKKYNMRQSRVAWLLFFTCCDVKKFFLVWIAHSLEILMPSFFLHNLIFHITSI